MRRRLSLSQALVCATLAIFALVFATPLLIDAQTPVATSGDAGALNAEVTVGAAAGTVPGGPAGRDEMPPAVATYPATETPTAPATVAVTDGRTPSVDPTTTPSPAETPTHSPPNTDSLAATSAMADVMLQSGQTQGYVFTYHVTTARAGTTVRAELRRADGAPADGWLIQAQTGQGDLTGDGATVEVTDASALTPDSAFSLTLVVQGPIDISESQTVSLSINSIVTTETGAVEPGVMDNDPVAALTMEPARAVHQRALSATPTRPANWGCAQDTIQRVPGALTFTCDGFIGDPGSTYTLSLSGLNPGWRYQYDGTWFTTNPTDPLETFKNTTLARFPIAIGPDPGASNPSANERVTLAINVASGGPSSVSATASLSVTSCEPTISATSALDFGTSAWDGDAYPAVSGALGLTVNRSTASGCLGVTDGWAIQVRMDDMRNAGGSIEAGAITFQGDGSTSNGITAVNANVTLSSSDQTIATGSASVSDGATWDAPFTLQPPDNAPPGDYSGTITITITGDGS